MSQQITPLRSCPGKEPTALETDWHHLPSAPNLGICSRCFADHLSRTPFASHFEAEHDTSNARRYCDFDKPRMHAVLARAVQTNDFGILSDWIDYRSRIGRCKGEVVGANIAEGYKWHAIANTPIEEFGTCHACYEDYLIPAGLASSFDSTQLEQTSEPWVCDTGSRLGLRLMQTCRNGSQFVTTLRYFAGLPACGGENADPTSGKWFRMRDPELSSLWFCEKCYFEWGVASILEPHVYQAGQPQLAPGQALVCDLGGNVPSRVAWNWALGRKDPDVFLRAARVIAGNPLCRSTGMGTQRLYFSLNPASPDFDICLSCYAGFVEAGDMPEREKHFIQKRILPGEDKICDFNLGTLRAIQYIGYLDDAIETRNPLAFTNAVRALASARPCQKGEPLRNTNWYRNDMFCACPECWALVVRGTSLDHVFTQRNENGGDNLLKCDFYSARVRAGWKEACAKNDLSDFNAFMTKRMEVFLRTYPQIQNLKAQLHNQHRLQMSMYTNSSLLRAGNSFAIASGATTGYSYGNASIGYHATISGAEGAAMFQQASSMTPNFGSFATQMAQLEGQWRAVE